MPIITGPAGMDPILGEMRTIDISGGTGGGGGSDYTFNSSEFTVSIAGLVSIKTIDASKITGKVASAGVADALVEGGTVGYAVNAGTASVYGGTVGYAVNAGTAGTANSAINAATATTANGVSQAVKDDIISSAGAGLDGEIASVDEVMTGITGGTTAVVDVTALRGALTAGQAVDVTSCPDGVTGNYRGTINISSSVLNFGFASFPKYASGLTYLMIADITPVSDITIGPGGSWLDGDRTGRVIAGGTTTRIAMLFDAADEAYFNFGSNHGDASVSNLREYEVTACTLEAIAYIAALSNPDTFSDYYLVKGDMVQPWTFIIDMGTSPAVTIASGLSYKLNATSGTHQLTVDTCPAGYDGRDSRIRITLGGNGVIQAVAPLQLGTALVPYAINNCVVQFRDGEAVLTLVDTLAGYVVSVSGGTADGSLYYGLSASDLEYMSFSPDMEGVAVDISGATANGVKNVVGNGYNETTLTGAVNCGLSKVAFVNLSMQDVAVNGGTMTLGDVNIPSGATVTVSGGSLAVEKVSGDGVIDLNNTVPIKMTSGTRSMAGVTVTKGNGTTAGGGLFISSGCQLSLNNVVVSGNSARIGAGALIASGGALYVTSSVISGNVFNSMTNARGKDIYLYGGATLIISGGTYGDMRIDNNAYGQLNGSCRITEGLTAYSSGGTVSITSGAVVDLTGNTTAAPIAPGGGVIVDGGCTVINSAGVSVAVAGGTYTQINKDGTTVPPQA